jgi:hypothetical protein
MKTEEGIFEHSVHQRRLRTRFNLTAPRFEELFRKRVDIGRPLIPGISIPMRVGVIYCAERGYVWCSYSRGYLSPVRI